jgi:hypothetical protein
MHSVKLGGHLRQAEEYYSRDATNGYNSSELGGHSLLDGCGLFEWSLASLTIQTIFKSYGTHQCSDLK